MTKKKPLSNTSEVKPLESLFANYQLEDKGGYITQEFQDFGYRLAVSLQDIEHKSLYIRLAKQYDRGLLESALSFVSDSQARSKAKLFMWKLKELKQAAASKRKDTHAK
jgi:hypothetical protein